MSQSTAVRIPARHARPAPRPVPAPPRLRVVAAPEHARSRAGVVVASVGLLVAGLVTVLLVQMSLERGAYALQREQSQARVLGEQRQALQEQIQQLKAPQNLARKAAGYGMVPAPNPAFLRARDGKVLGVPAPGVAAPSPTVKKAAPAAAPTGKATATAPGKAGGKAAGKVTGKATTGTAKGAAKATKPAAKPTSAGATTGKTTGTTTN
jgi:hypothetical protein